ncbi:MAG: alginate O-acetyltransferase complex protein AlgI [Blastocatellia bacterium]|jgi:D-alanyl-lipoteichoic acid acyltransferase DltB (MBOAT superfamily)|nr:alginate O-acetyltransferase complex protein AlgI [Blastocatellia bacterium]
MTFNSIAFALFLPIVFALYWFLPRRVFTQNLLLLIASYLFYAWWDYRFLALLFASSVLNYLLGLGLESEARPARRKLLLWSSLLVNIGTLVFFKYLGFFAASFAALLNLMGLRVSAPVLNIILPLGISYYTFQMLGYTIDVYRKQFHATRDLVSFLLFGGFFAKLVAGPIERASNLLPQLHQTRAFDTARAKDGLRQMLWGFFKKVVIADNLAGPVDQIYSHYGTTDGLTLLVGTFFFAMQIYCDFSGYSDMAIGTGRLFGLDLMRNFAYPYFSRDIAEFWRRWHISLSTWFRDYVFFPLGWLRRGKAIGVRNVLLTFTLSGLWHGADWTFISWGFLNGLYFIPQIMTGKQPRRSAVVAQGKLLPSLVELRQMLATFALVLLAWVFFRAASLSQAFHLLWRALTHPWLNVTHAGYLPLFAVCCALLLCEWFQRAKEHALEIAGLPLALRWAAYYVILALIFWYGVTGNVPFIYVKF